MAVKVVFLTTTSASSQTWTSPADFPASCTVEIIGAGGMGAQLAHGGGGGGGAYATKTLTGLAPNTAYAFMLNNGGAGAGACWFQSAGTVAADNGNNASGVTGGVGGAAASCIPTASAFSGGSGGTGTAAAGACGGGGSAGPSGAGKDGGTKAAGSGGSGGGGSNGGKSTAGVVSASSVGGAGGNGTGGTGGGAASTDGTAGTGAGGGGASTVVAGNGATSAIWTATAGGTAGPGGGGGGGSNSSPSAGGDGGLYGGGAGATGLGTGSTLGTPGQGLIVISYTPAGAANSISMSPTDPGTLSVDGTGTAYFTTTITATGYTSVSYASFGPGPTYTLRMSPVDIASSATPASITVPFKQTGDMLKVYDTASGGSVQTIYSGAVTIAAGTNVSPTITGARATSAAGGVGAAADVNASPAIIGAAMTAVAGNITPSRNLRLKPLIRGLVTWEAIPKASGSDQVACFNNYTDVSAHPGIFAAVQIQAGWWQLEPSRGTFTWDVIETALSNIRAYNAANPATPLVARMNIYPCQAAPDWAKNIGGPPLSVSVTAPGGGSSPITCGRFWTSDYIAAWVELLTAFAARYDSEPLMADIINTGTGVQTNEMWHQFTQSADIGVIKAAGYTDAQRLATINAAAGWHSVFTQTRFVQTMNEWHANDKGVLGPGSTVEPLAALTAARAQFGEQCIVSQASFNSPLEPNNSDLYPGIEAAGTPFDLTPQAPQFITDFNAVVNSAVSIGANSMDLWPIPTGWLANTDSQLKLWAAQLIANPTPSGNADVHGVVATASAGSVSVVTNPTFAYGIWCCHGAVPAAAAIYANPMIAGVSISLGWADIQPTAANAYDWSLIDGEIAHAVASGKQISIEIKVGASAPAWLFDTAGAPSISFKWWPTTYGPPAGTVVRAPLPWDSIFRNAWLTFIAAMGAKYSTSPTVSLIKVTGININTGELLLPYDMNGGTLGTILPSSDWAAAGYTPDGVLACFKMFADAYTQAFPRQVKSVQTGTWAFPPIDNSGTVIAQIDRAVVLAMQTYHANADPTCWLQANGVQAHWIYTRPASLPNVMLSIQAGGVVSDTINCKMNNGQKPCDTVQMTIDSVNLANGNRVSFLEWFQSDLTANNADENAALANFRPYQPGVSSTNIPGAAAVAHAGDVALRYGASPAIDGDRAAAGAGAVALSLSSSLALTGAAAAALAGAVLGGVGTATSVAGAAVTTAAGVVGLRIDGSAAIFGASATALHGAVNLSLGGAVGVTGCALAASVGAVTFAIGVTASATGAAGATAAGNVSLGLGGSVAILGAGGAVSAGSIGVALAPSIAVAGATASSAAGAIALAIGAAIAVAGASVSSLAGSVAVGLPASPVITGAAVVSSPGLAVASTGIAALGAAANATAGAPGAGVSAAISGAVATAAAGTAQLSLGRATPILGASAGTAAGPVAAQNVIGILSAVAAAMPGVIEPMILPMPAGVAAGAFAGNAGPAMFKALAGASAITFAGRAAAGLDISASVVSGAFASAGIVGISSAIIFAPAFGARSFAAAGDVAASVTRLANKGARLAGWQRPNQIILNWIAQMATNDIPIPVWLPAMRAGETDGRYMDCSPDLGPTGDMFTSILSLSVAISRQDGMATTADDLHPAGAAWPDALDATQLIPTFGFTAPLLSSGVAYNLVLTANPTAQGRVFIRDWMMLVATALG